MQLENHFLLLFWQCFVFLSLTVSQDFKMTWDRYYSLEDIEHYMESLAKDFNFITTTDIGKTYEGRTIKVLRMGLGLQQNASALVVGGIHANEHIGPAATTFLMNHILQSKLNGTSSNFLDVNYYFIPVANPDGYKYSFETDRNWSKNREPILWNDKTYYGVDLNRNWKTGWKRHKGPWQPHYSGAQPFSAAETNALKDFIRSSITNLNTFVTIHNYGQHIIYPWNYMTTPIRDDTQIQRVAEKMAFAIKAQGGPMYSVGSGAETLTVVPGTPEDWVRYRAQVKFVFSLILRDQGNYGYNVPPELIPVVSGDAVAAFTSLIGQIKFLHSVPWGGLKISQKKNSKSI